MAKSISELMDDLRHDVVRWRAELVAYVSNRYRAQRDLNLERGLEVRRQHALEAARTLKQTQLWVAMLLLSLLMCLLIYLVLTR
jgi:hypothetical protein